MGVKIFKTIQTLEDMTQQGLREIKTGVDIAATHSARASINSFKEVLPEVYNTFYEYVSGGVNKMGSVTFTQEDYKAVKNIFIPVSIRFEYQMLEHLYYYELSRDKEVQSRSKELFEFIKGFEEVTEGVFIKLCRMYVYLIDINTGIVRKRKFKEVKRLDGYIKVRDGKADIVIDGRITNLYHNGILWGTDLWKQMATSRQKGYQSFEVSKIGCFRVHTVIIALKYGIEVAKFLLGNNSYLTVEHKDKDTSNNAISNLCIYTRKSNRVMAGNQEHNAFDFVELFKEMFILNKYYYLI